MRAVKAWLQVYYRSKIQSIEICLLLRVFSPTRGAVLNAPPSQYISTAIGFFILSLENTFELSGKASEEGKFKAKKNITTEPLF